MHKSALPALSILIATSITQAATITTIGTTTENFSSLPALTDWGTKTIAGGSGTWSTTADVVNFISTTGFDATTGLSQLSSITSYTSNANGRYHATNQHAYTQPGGSSAGSTIVAQYFNNTGNTLTGFTISYDISRIYQGGGENDTPTGRQIYYSLTGTGTSWTPLTTLINGEAALNTTGLNEPTNTNGTILNSASLSQTVSATWANNSTLYLLWVDDNDGNTDIVYTVDNAALTVVPEASSTALIGLASLALLARRRRA